MSGNFLADAWDEEGNGSAFSNLTKGDTLTCAARNIQGPIDLPYSSALTITMRVIQSIYYLVVILGGLFLNTFVIVLVARYKKLHTMSFFISLQVVALNLLLSVAMFPGLVTAIANRWLLSEYVCAINGLLINITVQTRTFLMCVFVIDRYLAVVWPYFYPKHKLKVTVTLSVASWFFSALVSFAMLPGLLDCYRLSSISRVCFFSSTCSAPCSILVRINSAITVPLTVLPVVLYALLYYKSRRIQKEMASEATGNTLNNYRHEWKATITFSLLFLTLFILVVPIIVINIVIAALFPGRTYPPAAYAIAVVNSALILLLTITDPIVIMRDKDVKEVLSKIKNTVFRVRSTNHTGCGITTATTTRRTTRL